MQTPYTPPAQGLAGFNCPHCNAFAHMNWGHALPPNQANSSEPWGGVWTYSRCSRCGRFAVWQDKLMVWPGATGIEPPNEDLDEAIKVDYLEAASIASRSPRGAAAILRLVVQKLCVQLGKSGGRIDDDIASLVKDGMPKILQQSLDIVRVVGNNAVHPGELDIQDDSETVIALFKLVNSIAQDRISHPKEVAKMYSSLPQGARDAIEKRDKNPDNKILK